MAAKAGRRISNHADIATDQGILVDDTMSTSVPGVFAAGDVAQAAHCLTGQRVSCGTWSNACEQGRVAGLNLVGSRIHWTGGLNRNLTTLFGNTLGSVGMMDASAAPGEGRHPAKLKNHRDRRRQTSRRLVFSDGRRLGAVLWNACNDLGILNWSIGTRRDCSGWEDRVTRGDNLFGETLGPRLARGPLGLFRMEKTP